MLHHRIIPPLSVSDIARFWKRVTIEGAPRPDLDPCWLMDGGARNEHGYPAFKLGRTNFLANRVAWTLGHGPIPIGSLVLHRCDTPRCVNYESHLFLGSHTDNAQDRAAKGRGNPPRGTDVRIGKLNEDTVRDIRRRWRNGESQRGIARWHHVSSHTVYSVVHRYTWRHVG